MRTRQKVILGAATGLIMGIAAWVSYWHMAELCVQAGESLISAHLIPLLPDASMAVAAVVQAAPGGTRRRRVWSRVTLCLGVAASLGANVATADAHPVAMVIAAWPAVTLLCTAEMLLSLASKTSPPRRRRAPARARVKAPAKAAAAGRRLAAA